MKLTNAEKLSLLILCDIAEGKTDIDTKIVREAIQTDNTWAIPWELHGFTSEETPKHVNEVCETFDMYHSLEASYDELSKEDKAKVDASPLGNLVYFPGYDGNHEGEYMSAASFLVRDLKRYDHFKGRENLNAHTGTVDAYRLMHAKWIKTGGGHELSADQIISILKARLS